MLSKIKKIILLINILLINTKNVDILNTYNILFDSYQEHENITLTIPTISFSKTFNIYSTLKDSIELDKNSSLYPSDNNTIIILGHSGYNYNAYFNDLFYLKNNDKIYLKYGNINYTYKIIYIEYIKKNTKYKIEYNKNYLYLVTCDLYDFNKQIVIKSSKI